MSRRKSHRTPMAFTLIELLVVLAIIAVLIALLLPSVTSARNTAYRTRCLHNIREIGLALQIYTQDYHDYPAATDGGSLGAQTLGKGVTPVYYAARRTGLLSLTAIPQFSQGTLTCPVGWASGGDAVWWVSGGFSPAGAAYMDYAYWANRYPPTLGFDAKAASFTYRYGEKGTKILVCDTVSDCSFAATAALVGSGNHMTNQRALRVTRTDGQGHALPSANLVRSLGSNVLFSDYHAQWYSAEHLTQQADGICFPPPDQW
jgi:prepilin-type N-terminal cleavage/methylation domain-containing protein